jgi:hypothetical protein
MIKIKISADNERLLNKAKTEGELRGAVDLILERIAQSKADGLLKKVDDDSTSAGSPYAAKKVLATLRDSLGDDLRVPPFPDATYYQYLFRQAKINDLQGDRLIALAQKVKETMKPPFDPRFMLQAYDRIMAGTVFGQARFVANTFNKRNGRSAPPLPSLPEE